MNQIISATFPVVEIKSGNFILIHGESSIVNFEIILKCHMILMKSSIHDCSLSK